ncbi:MAG TPA: DUF2071 domain-containing protein [Planctomycetaceae bacterium]|nr:DUF2071 domain-containing protein [Planctomycetaceae bacterium]
MPATSQVLDVGRIDRISPTARPAGRHIGYHQWRNLLFVHWRLPADLVRPLLPRELTLDTWEGDAWVGLVPFYMLRVRPRWSPPIPGISYFCETNVRTYVHFQGRDPGVWFFSLDASNSLAVRVARRRWHLPYFRAKMQHARRGDQVAYSSRRLWPGEAGPGCEIKLEAGPPLGQLASGHPLPAGQAAPGTLEHFLIERYVLYAQPALGKLLIGRVHHRPYPIRQVGALQLDETLLSAAGISRPATHSHLAFSDGVDVEIFPLTPVADLP